jgi:hypothetical protein
MDFEKRELNSEDLATVLEFFVDEINKIADKIEYTETEGSKMPYDLRVLNRKLNKAYKNMLAEYNLFRRIDAKVKTALFSQILSLSGTNGFFSPWTGEAVINPNIPDYKIPFVAAHEFAHLMGVAREDEANFIAFLVCLFSDDEYIRYSGLMAMVSYVSWDLIIDDWETHYRIMQHMPAIVRNDRESNFRFISENTNRTVSRTASRINNTYLKVQGQEKGVRSYAAVVDLVVSYLIDN